MHDVERHQYRAAIRAAQCALEASRTARREEDRALALLSATLELTPMPDIAPEEADFHERRTEPVVDTSDTDRPSFSELVGGCEEEGDVEPAAGDFVYVSLLVQQ